MKFVNKLTVLSLIVLMFSFMNVANAAGIDNKQVPACKGRYLGSCAYSGGGSDAQKADNCNNTYTSLASGGKATQCKWGETLSPLPNKDGSFNIKWSCQGGGGSCSTWGDTR